MTIQKARLLIVPLLKLLHIPVVRRNERRGRMGPILAKELLKAARRHIHVPLEWQALAMLEQHAQILLLLEGHDIQHGDITDEQLAAKLRELAPAYLRVLERHSDRSTPPVSVDRDKGVKANTVATEASAKGKVKAASVTKPDAFDL